MESVKGGNYEEIDDRSLRTGPSKNHCSMILPTYPGKIPQTSLNPTKKDIPKHKLLVKGPFGIFQGYVGEILELLVDLNMRPQNESGSFTQHFGSFTQHFGANGAYFYRSRFDKNLWRKAD